MAEEKESRLERRAKRKEQRQDQIALQRSQFHKRERNKKIFNYSILALIALAIAYAIYANASAKVVSGEHDKLAQCLTKKGVTMYGTDWCPHCQDQKRLFGDSFKYVTFINCDINAQACTAAGVEGYPTWIFPVGTRMSGLQPLEKLAELADCAP